MLEVLGGLEELMRRLAVNSRENNALCPPPLPYLHDKQAQWSNKLDERDDGALEAFRSVRDFIVDVHSRLTRVTQLSSEHLALHLESSAFESFNPEIGLLIHLYSYLPVPIAIDVGASRGDISQQLLDFGYELYAFEPSPQVFKELQDRLIGREQCHLYELGVGAADAIMQLQIAEDSSANRIYGDVSLFSSIISHSMPEGLSFVQSVDVQVRSLRSLATEGKIPNDIGLLKVDTEGYDLQVLRGMGDLRPHVVMAEFWSPDFVFGRGSTYNRLNDLVKEMRARGYRWHTVLYRLAGADRVSFYSNHDCSIRNSWGNVFFFRDYQLFMRADEWCSAILPRTYLNAQHGAKPWSLAHDGAVFELNAKVETLEKLLGTRDERARRLEESLAARGHDVTLLSDQARSLRERVSQLESVVGSARAALQERATALGELQDKIRELQDKIRRIRGSFSWKLTSPLRELRRIGLKLAAYLGWG
jgi:FkbM family methyltransferase